MEVAAGRVAAADDPAVVVDVVSAAAVHAAGGKHAEVGHDAVAPDEAAAAAAAGGGLADDRAVVVDAGPRAEPAAEGAKVDALTPRPQDGVVKPAGVAELPATWPRSLMAKPSLKETSAPSRSTSSPR